MYGNNEEDAYKLQLRQDKPQHLMYGNALSCGRVENSCADKPQHLMYGNFFRRL